MQNKEATSSIKNTLSQKVLQHRTTARMREDIDPRGSYFRDVTAIMHSTPFRRLKHKTQVFFAPANDHICTRLEHVLHVSSIAVTICKALNLDTDMAWAIGLGHDLGHTPFGHLGETVLTKLTKKYFNIDHPFQHELHSLRVIDILSKLNLTYAVRDGIVTHCGEKFEKEISPTHTIEDISSYTDKAHYPATFEGTIVRVSDKIAYLGRDYEDAVTLGVIDRDSLPLPILQALHGSENTNIINSLALDVITQAKEHGTIGFSEEVYEAFLLLKNYNYECIYKSTQLEKQGEKFEKILGIIYEHLFTALENNNDDMIAYKKSESSLIQHFGQHLNDFFTVYQLSDKNNLAYHHMQALTDYIAGMTDNYAISVAKDILFPHIEIDRL